MSDEPAGGGQRLRQHSELDHIASPVIATHPAGRAPSHGREIILVKRNTNASNTEFAKIRHTAASLAVSAGANVKAVQRMLGHAKASMALDVYADLFDEDLDDVATTLDAAIRSAADRLRTGPSKAAPLANADAGV